MTRSDCRAATAPARPRRARDTPCGVRARRRSVSQAAARSSVRRHEDRQPEAGEMVQRLVDADQPPEPLVIHGHVKRRDAKPLAAVNDEVDDEIDKGDEPEFWRDDKD